MIFLHAQSWLVYPQHITLYQEIVAYDRIRYNLHASHQNETLLFDANVTLLINACQEKIECANVIAWCMCSPVHISGMRSGTQIKGSTFYPYTTAVLKTTVNGVRELRRNTQMVL